MTKRRAWLGFAGLLLCFAVVGLGPAVTAKGAVVGPSETCNPFAGRDFCITISSWDQVTASDTGPNGVRYTYAQWSMRNNSGSAQTHPSTIVTLPDLCGSTPTLCDSKGTSTAAFVLSTLTLPNSSSSCTLKAGALTCTYPDLPAGASTDFTSIYFKTADTPATGTEITVKGNVKQRARDANQCGTAGDPNCDTFTATLDNSYEGDLLGADTWALNGNRFHLPSNDEHYSFNFTSTSQAPFLAQFKAQDDSSGTYCFSSVPCFDKALSADTAGVLSYGSTVVFSARLLSPPPSVTDKNLSAVHFYDPLTLHADESSDQFTAPSTVSFEKMDGVRFASDPDPSAVIQPGKYFIVNYQPATGSSPQSFQVSTTKGGSQVPLGTGDVKGSPIRIIGDQSDERSTIGCTTTFSNAIPIPSICVLKVKSTQELDSWVWDSGNGFVKH